MITPKVTDLSGKQFGRLTVLHKVGNTKNRDSKWLCVCECGNTITALQSNLVRNHTRSCGCLRNEKSKDRLITHGKSKERLYNTWIHMRQRCKNPHCKEYPLYGGRGITVCDKWENNFMAFHDWAFSHGYSNDLTIDRIDVNGNYEPSNCRWSTAEIQSNNQRKNCFLTYNGKTQTLAEWANALNIPYSTLKNRICNYHWTVKRAFSEPVRKKKEKGLSPCGKHGQANKGLSNTLIIEGESEIVNAKH